MAKRTDGRCGLGLALGLTVALALGCGETDPAADRDELGEGVQAIVGATVYPAPDEGPIPDGVVLIRDGTIFEVGPRADVAVPPEATVIEATGTHLFAGFQNSHVHFTEPRWHDAETRLADELSAQLEEMLLRYGFTAVVDVGSPLARTLALRERITAGEVRGPRILTAGTPLYPVGGIPFYLKESLDEQQLANLHTPAMPDEAGRLVEEAIDAGADVVKLFTGSWVERGTVKPMDVEVARAAARKAHDRGELVFAHASNVAGLEVALEAGVDVLAHALDDDRGFDETHIARMRDAKMAMIPTLSLFAGQEWTKYVVQLVRDYAEAGGVVLFGTDVGYLTEYDPSEEYRLLAEAGLDWRAIHATLTTAPAERLNQQRFRGRIAPGKTADLVVLGSDPALDVTAFADVRSTFVAGRLVYQKSE